MTCQEGGAVVTGGAQGIGRAIAERFLASGASVSLWDRDASLAEAAAAELSALGTVHHATVDVSNDGGVEAAVMSTVGALGRVDILVANAGITGPNMKLWEYPMDAWRQVMEVNLNGVFLSCRAVVPLMLRQNYGRIVNVASIAGKEGNANASAYSASKAGVIALTKSLGKELCSTLAEDAPRTDAATNNDSNDSPQINAGMRAPRRPTT